MFEQELEIPNPSLKPLEVWFEPWGDCQVLGPGQSFRVVANSEEDGQFDVERQGGWICIYGWPGCTMRVHRGDELVVDLSITFPELPPGMSTRTMVRLMFGGPGGAGASDSGPGRYTEGESGMRHFFRSLVARLPWLRRK